MRIKLGYGECKLRVCQHVALMLLGAALSTVVGWVEANSPVPLLVRADADHSTTGGDDMGRLREIASGSSWESATVPEMYGRLRAIGWRYLRLINVEWNFQAVGKDGKPVYSWEGKLRSGLQTCKDLGLTPHICIGIVQPPAIPKYADEFTDADWQLYEQYIYDFLRHVLGEWQFPEASGKPANPRFSCIPRNLEKESITDSKNTRASKSRMGNLG